MLSINAADVQTRMFLLVKGQHTFINIELGLDPEWFPEYELPSGSPTDALNAAVDGKAANTVTMALC